MLSWWRSLYANLSTSNTASLQQQQHQASAQTSRGFHQSSEFASQQNDDVLEVLICGRGQLFYADAVEENWSERANLAEFLDAKESSNAQDCCNACATVTSTVACTAYFYSRGICSLYKLMEGQPIMLHAAVRTVAPTPPQQQQQRATEMAKMDNPFEQAAVEEEEDNPFEQAGDVEMENPFEQAEEKEEEEAEEERSAVVEEEEDVQLTLDDDEEEDTVASPEPPPMAQEESAAPPSEALQDDTPPQQQQPETVDVDIPDFPSLDDDDDDEDDNEEELEQQPIADTKPALPIRNEHTSNDIPDIPLDDEEDKEEEEEQDHASTAAATTTITTTTSKKQQSSLDLALESLASENDNNNKQQEPHALSLDDLLNGEDLDAEEDAEEDGGDGGEDYDASSAATAATTNAPKPQRQQQQSHSLSDLVGTNEIQLSPEQNAKLAQLPINNFLIAGAYSVTITDPFYANKNCFKFFGRFRAVSEMNDFMLEFQAAQQGSSKHPVDFFTLGMTAEGRPIKAVEIGNPTRGKHVFIVGGLRGCDWTAPLASLHAIVSLMGRRRSTAALLDAVRFHFVPLVNVDGYYYSRRKSPATARHWCDNRRVSGGGHGVNLERNFGERGKTWGFGKEGKEGRKDKLGFQGLEAFSEPETQVVRDYIKHFATGAGRVAVVHVRCCSGSLSPPQALPGSGGGAHQRDPALIILGANTLGANLRSNGNDYTVVTRNEPFGADNTGQLIDWTYNALGVDHSYAVEIKAFSLTTHNDRYQISPEPFMALAKELEVGIVTTAQLLLNQPIQGAQAPGPYRPKIVEKAAASSSSGKKK